jgi:3-oxoacyl-[acyl-carrier-protein] synthase II
MHGHLLGAAGALEFVATLLALETGSRRPPSTCACRIPSATSTTCRSRHADPGRRAALSSSFAFGGTNAVLAAAV